MIDMQVERANDGEHQLYSMTGFGRSSGEHAGRAWLWELKSVNGRGLEARFRTPPGYDSLEADCRKALGGRVSRGNVSCSLTLDSDPAVTGVVVNAAALEAALVAIEAIRARIETAPPRPEAILALRGVLDSAPGEVVDDAGRVDLYAELLAGFERATGELCEARASEGAALYAALGAQIDEVDRLAVRAAGLAVAATEAVRNRLIAQLADLIDSEKLAPDRLAQEAALLAVKADVREETDRLMAHVAAFRDLLAGGGPVGRRLDFLTQELNREANTLCAKAPVMELKGIGLDLKAVIDQLREQVQNLE